MPHDRGSLPRRQHRAPHGCPCRCRAGVAASRPSAWSDDDGYLDYEVSVTEFLRGQPSEAPDVTAASVHYYVHHAPVADYARRSPTPSWCSAGVSSSSPASV
jgi:hypothetical protein